jgi:hypothetical protein
MIQPSLIQITALDPVVREPAKKQPQQAQAPMRIADGIPG